MTETGMVVSNPYQGNFCLASESPVCISCWPTCCNLETKGDACRHQTSLHAQMYVLASSLRLMSWSRGLILHELHSGERRPGTVGLPLPGVTVKVAPGSEEDEESQQHGAHFHEGTSWTRLVVMVQVPFIALFLNPIPPLLPHPTCFHSLNPFIHFPPTHTKSLANDLQPCPLITLCAS